MTTSKFATLLAALAQLVAAIAALIGSIKLSP